MNLEMPSTLSVSHPAPWKLDSPWTVEARERVTCPDCGQTAFREPVCRVTDSRGNLLREERPIVCICQTLAAYRASAEVLRA